MRPSFVSFPWAPPLLSICSERGTLIPSLAGSLLTGEDHPELFNLLFHPSFSTFNPVQLMPSLTYKNKQNWAKLSRVWISLGEVGRGWKGVPRMRVSMRLIRVSCNS